MGDYIGKIATSYQKGDVKGYYLNGKQAETLFKRLPRTIHSEFYERFK